MISIDNGHYSRDGFELSISLDISAGENVSIIGPSGAGKSTLLNIIAGFEQMASGRVELDGRNATQLAPAERPVTFIFQDNNSFAHLSARDNVALGVLPSLRLSPGQWQMVDGALDRVGLGNLAARRPGEMSGGERQRIALARMLVRRRPIVLLDEPFAALGPALQQNMMALLKSLQAEHNLTVLLVTHQPTEAKALGGKVVFVDGGRVNAPVSSVVFFRAPPAAAKAYLGS